MVVETNLRDQLEGLEYNEPKEKFFAAKKPIGSRSAPENTLETEKKTRVLLLNKINTKLDYNHTFADLGLSEPLFIEN